MSFLKRAQTVPGERGGAAPFPDEKFAKRWPALFEYMTATQYPDGTTRKASSVTLFAEDCQIKGCLSEKDQGLVLFGSSKTLEGLLSALEGLLTAPETPWRRSGGGKDFGGGKGQKKG